MTDTPIGDELAAQYGTEADVDPAQAKAFGVGANNPPAPPGPNSPPVDENNAPLDPVEQALDPGVDPEAGAVEVVEFEPVEYNSGANDELDDLDEVDPTEGGVEALSVEGLPDVDEPEDDDPEADEVAGDDEAADAEPDDPFAPEATS